MASKHFSMPGLTIGTYPLVSFSFGPSPEPMQGGGVSTARAERGHPSSYNLRLLRAISQLDRLEFIDRQQKACVVASWEGKSCVVFGAVYVAVLSSTEASIRSSAVTV